jgi:hypothetical protein
VTDQPRHDDGRWRELTADERHAQHLADALANRGRKHGVLLESISRPPALDSFGHRDETIRRQEEDRARAAQLAGIEQVTVDWSDVTPR